MKLMIAAAIICAAAFSQAGAVKWSATSPAYPSGLAEGVTYTAYYFDASSADLSTVAGYLTADTPDLASFASAAADTHVAAYDTSKEMLSFSAQAYGSYAQGETANGFVIIVDNADIANAKNFCAIFCGTFSLRTHRTEQNKTRRNRPAVSQPTTAHQSAGRGVTWPIAARSMQAETQTKRSAFCYNLSHENDVPHLRPSRLARQHRLAGRRLTFHKMRLSGASGMFNRKDDKFWLGAVASWEAVGEGDRTGCAEFRLSFPDKDTQEFAAHLVMQSSFAFLDEVTGTFAKGVDPDDGWAFQLEDVSLLPSGMVKCLDGLGDGVVPGDELVRRIGTNFTPMEHLSISLLLKGREISFTSAVVESCRPCWTNDTLSLTCRLTPLVRNGRGRQNPFRISFEVPAEKATALRRTPIPGDLVIKIKGRPIPLGTPSVLRSSILGRAPIAHVRDNCTQPDWQLEVTRANRRMWSIRPPRSGALDSRVVEHPTPA